MVSNKTFICETCNYTTNRKFNLELHKRSQNACKKRLNIHDKNQLVVPSVVSCSPKRSHTVVPNVVPNDPKSFPIVATSINFNSLQCQTCKKEFSCRQNKHRHSKRGNCKSVLTEDQQMIKELQQRLDEKEKQLEDERSKPTINNITNNITNNTNNYFDHSINYNNYDNLSLEHITKEDIKRLYNNCRMQYPELSEDLTRMILGPKENQCIYLPEGQKSNTCAVMKDGIEMRKPLIRVLMDLGVQTAMLIRDSDVIERNKKDVVNNQFWADNRNASGLNISDIDYMTDGDKEIVQRNKNIVLDMCDGKI
tara:strand:- start:3994 stop:4920 length:927 start_codon:yes stop_codon:yes gene_type:complete